MLKCHAIHEAPKSSGIIVVVCWKAEKMEKFNTLFHKIKGFKMPLIQDLYWIPRKVLLNKKDHDWTALTVIH